MLNGKDKLLDSGWSGSYFNIKQTNRCRDCGRNMHEAESCDKKRVGTLVDNEGKSFDRNRFEDRSGECSNCRIKTGGIHHKRCDRERSHVVMSSSLAVIVSGYLITRKNQTIDLTKRYLL